MGTFSLAFGKGLSQQGTLLNPSNGITEEDTSNYIIEEDSNNIIIEED